MRTDARCLSALHMLIVESVIADRQFVTLRASFVSPGDIVRLERKECEVKRVMRINDGFDIDIYTSCGTFRLSHRDRISVKLAPDDVRRHSALPTPSFKRKLVSDETA